MPFVTVQSVLPIDAAMADTLQKGIGNLISIIPGKNIDNCMINIQGGCSMFISGAPVKAVFCEVRLFKPAPFESKSEFCAKINELFTEKLGADKVTLNIIEMEEWGAGPNYRT